LVIKELVLFQLKGGRATLIEVTIAAARQATKPAGHVPTALLDAIKPEPGQSLSETPVKFRFEARHVIWFTTAKEDRAIQAQELKRESKCDVIFYIYLLYTQPID
jgi:hypothetical protein